MYQYCPVTCGSPECSNRCTREEEPDSTGKRCWEYIEQDGLSCIDAITRGLDCHCKCGSAYLVVSGTAYRHNGGPFTWKERIQGRSLEQHFEVQADQDFVVSLTGEAMSLHTDTGVHHARLKVVEKSAPCSHASNAEGVGGLLCERPPGSDVLAIAVCDTEPALATAYLHRWTGLSINACGDFDICHCNSDCNVRDNWKLAGRIKVSPPSEDMSLFDAPRGCEAYLPTPPPLAMPTGAEHRADLVVRVGLSLSGGLLELHRQGPAEMLTAVQLTLAQYLGTQSDLLGKKTPEALDIDVRHVARRLRALFGPEASAPPGAEMRRLQDCADDDQRFRADAPDGLGLRTCSEGVGIAGNVATFCRDLTMAEAVKHCRTTCSLCAESSSPSPSDQSEGSGSPAPTPAPWPGGPGALKFRITIRTWTGTSNRVVMARLEQLRESTFYFIQMLVQHLSDVGFAESMPSTTALGAFLAEGPVSEEAPTPAPLQSAPDPDAATAGIRTSHILIIVSCGVGFLLLCGFLGGCLWFYCMDGDDEATVVPVELDVEERISRSKGGYRTKKSTVVTERQPKVALKRRRRRGCCNRLLRCCSSCFLPSFDLPTTVEPPAAAPAPVGCLATGTQVRVHGLAAAPHLNGAMGTVASGPNENGRYLVDLAVDNGSMRVEQSKALKPENLQPLA